MLLVRSDQVALLLRMALARGSICDLLKWCLQHAGGNVLIPISSALNKLTCYRAEENNEEPNAASEQAFNYARTDIIANFSTSTFLSSSAHGPENLPTWLVAMLVLTQLDRLAQMVDVDDAHFLSERPVILQETLTLDVTQPTLEVLFALLQHFTDQLTSSFSLRSACFAITTLRIFKVNMHHFQRAYRIDRASGLLSNAQLQSIHEALSLWSNTSWMITTSAEEPVAGLNDFRAQFASITSSILVNCSNSFDLC